MGILIQVAMLFAQDASLLTGVGGWAGAGLLGLVLGWLLMRHLPAKDQQIKDFIESKDMLVKDMITEFKGALHLVVTHCRDENLLARKEYREQTETLRSLWSCFLESSKRELAEKGLTK